MYFLMSPSKKHTSPLTFLHKGWGIPKCFRVLKLFLKAAPFTQKVVTFSHISYVRTRSTGAQSEGACQTVKTLQKNEGRNMLDFGNYGHLLRTIGFLQEEGRGETVEQAHFGERGVLEPDADL